MAAIIMTCIWEVPGFNLVWDLKYSEFFMAFFSSTDNK